MNIHNDPSGEQAIVAFTVTTLHKVVLGVGITLMTSFAIWLSTAIVDLQQNVALVRQELSQTSTKIADAEKHAARELEQYRKQQDAMQEMRDNLATTRSETTKARLDGIEARLSRIGTDGVSGASATR